MPVALRDGIGPALKLCGVRLQKYKSGGRSARKGFIHMKIMSAVSLTASCCFVLAGTAGASGDSLALALRQLQAGTEHDIQAKIVDPILGAGNAYVFAEMSVDLVLKESGQSKEGIGSIRKVVSTETFTEAASLAEALGEQPEKKQKPEEPAKAGGLAKPGIPYTTEQAQTAEQGKKELEQRLGVELEVKSFSLRILHNTGVSKEKLELLSKTILALYPKAVKGQTDLTITLVPASFAKKGDTWMEKLAK